MTSLALIEGIRPLLCLAAANFPQSVVVGFLVRKPQQEETQGLNDKTLWALDVYLCLPDGETMTYTYVCDAEEEDYQNALNYFSTGGRTTYH